MNYVKDLIAALLNWALFLAISGGLATATALMAGRAAMAHRTGLISLQKLNSQLMNPVQKAHNTSRRNARSIALKMTPVSTL